MARVAAVITMVPKTTMYSVLYSEVRKTVSVVIRSM